MVVEWIRFWLDLRLHSYLFRIANVVQPMFMLGEKGVDLSPLQHSYHLWPKIPNDKIFPL